MTKLEALKVGSASVLKVYWEQVNRLRHYLAFDFFEMKPDQKKEVLGILLDEFVLNGDGRIELRFKLPVNETWVAEVVAGFSTQSHDDKSWVW